MAVTSSVESRIRTLTGGAVADYRVVNIASIPWTEVSAEKANAFVMRNGGTTEYRTFPGNASERSKCAFFLHDEPADGDSLSRALIMVRPAVDGENRMKRVISTSTSAGFYMVPMRQVKITVTAWHRNIVTLTDGSTVSDILHQSAVCTLLVNPENQASILTPTGWWEGLDEVVSLLLQRAATTDPVATQAFDLLSGIDPLA